MSPLTTARLTLHRAWRACAGVLLLALLISPINSAVAAPPANDAFMWTWARPDQPVADGIVSRTWIWGPEAFTGAISEPYGPGLDTTHSEILPSEERTVQYYDKSRMEIGNPDADPNSIWYVTNGLLVTEMLTGKLQVGDERFVTLAPAQINVAGDADDTVGPTYATFSLVLDEAAKTVGSQLIERLSRDGQITADPTLSSHNIAAGFHDDVTGHTVAGPFWDFMNSTGLVWDDGEFVSDQLFENPYFATGRPLTEAYWATVKVAGNQTDVLTQCFERRCLTYTPGNPAGWQVESGNVGQHYYHWRYLGQGFADDRNGKLVYAQNGNIIVVDDDAATRITDAPTDATYYDPTWSPDGSQIAYMRTDADGYNGLYIMDADGTNNQEVIGSVLETGQSQRYRESPAWSPDGSQIAFSTDEGSPSNNLFVVNVDGSGLTELGCTSNDICGGRDPKWSPDGSQIAYESGYTTSRLMLTTPNGAEPVEVAVIEGTRDGWSTGIDWSPDGSRFVVSTTSATYLIDSDGSNRIDLDSCGGWNPIWISAQEIAYGHTYFVEVCDVTTGDTSKLYWSLGVDYRQADGFGMLDWVTPAP